jgi:uncharacterized membrane-anchored protein
MKRIRAALSDKTTTISGAIGALFVILKAFNLIPDSISNQLPSVISEIVGGIMSLLLIFRAGKPKL